jgi:predicted PurR-regulated permease PerM
MLNNYSAQAQDYLTTTILPQLQAMLKNISAGVFDLLIFLKNFLIGAIVSIYLMVDKEEFVAKSKMLTFVILPNRWANFLIHAMRFTSKTFGGFISGKLLDSAIIGVLCYIGTIILGTPYALLVSVIIGVTNIIPFFGPYLGAIPSIFLILLSDPIQSLYFAIFVLILQQFDGNILGPKIIGESTGLSSFLVIVSILV